MRWFVTSSLLCALIGCAQKEAPPAPVSSNTPAAIAAAAPTTAPAARQKPYVLHLPGVSGTSMIDYSLRSGLRSAGFDGPFEIFDWTCHDPGIPALHNRARNEAQAQIVAERLTDQYRAHPDQPIYLTCHSGGSGPATWALEKLPPDVRVACFVMLAPALSPTYDLTKALTHVTGNAYCFNSNSDDLVLGTGTRMFGTIDGQLCDAAGRIGFKKPAAADASQYAKLVAKPYQNAWMQYGHIGGHVGCMGAAFVEAIVAPAMLGRPASAKALNSTVANPMPDVLWPKGQ